MAVEVETGPLSVSETRNSSLRQNVAFIPETIAWAINKVAPEPLSNPNLFTLASALLTPIAVAKTTWRNIHKPDAVYVKEAIKESGDEIVGLTASQAADWIDGPLGREKNRIKPGSHDTRWGGLYDSLNDRWGHLWMGGSRIIAACLRGDWYGMFVAETATITGPWPAYLRSEKESKGEIVSESGEGWMDLCGFFGTHAGRTLLAILATLYPNITVTIREKTIVVPVQNISDTVSTVSNIVTIVRRIRAGRPMKLLNPEDKEYTKKMAKRKEIIDDAKYRRYWLLGAAVGTGVVVVGLHFLLPKKEN